MNDQNHPPLGVAVDRDVGPETEAEALKRELMEAHQRANEQWDRALSLLGWITAQAVELGRLRSLCAAAYQVVGAADGPVEMLDNLAAAGNAMTLPHEPHAGLPWTPNAKVTRADGAED